MKGSRHKEMVVKGLGDEMIRDIRDRAQDERKGEERAEIMTRTVDV